MRAMVTPRVSIPSVCPPTVMIVAAWVSCFRFRVNRSPFFVVTSSESGMGPTMREVPGRQEAWAPGFITSPMPRSTAVGPKHTAAMMRAARIFRIPGTSLYVRGSSTRDKRSRRQGSNVGWQVMNIVNATGREDSTGSVPQMPSR